jgi:hypothetical protein
MSVSTVTGNKILYKAEKLSLRAASKYEQASWDKLCFPCHLKVSTETIICLHNTSPSISAQERAHSYKAKKKCWLSQDRLVTHFKLRTESRWAWAALTGTEHWGHRDRAPGSQGQSTMHLTWTLAASSFGSVCHSCCVGACIQDQKLLWLDG